MMRRVAGRAYHRLRYPRFTTLRDTAGGMLSPPVYDRLYRTIRHAPDADVVEIGGAAGAGSIAISWALRDAGKRARLIVVEKCEGGSRAEFGDRNENLAILHRHLAAFGAHDVRIFPHELTLDNGAQVLDLVATPRIGALVHDADGHLDRDFALFWPRLEPGAPIVIDDVMERPAFKPVSARHPQGGTKGVLTHRLLTQLTEWGLFEPQARVRDTLFGRKPAHADFGAFDLDRCQEIHREVLAEHAATLRR